MPNIGETMWEQGAISQTDYEEHSHIGGVATNPAGKQALLLGFGKVTNGLMSLASAGFAQPIPASGMTNRRSLVIYNSSVSTIWIGSPSLSSGYGIPIERQAVMAIDSHSNLYACPVFSGQTLNYMELG